MDVDQLIRATLEVKPSAEFVAQVRARIAGEPRPAMWSWRNPRVHAGVAAVAAVIVFAVVTVRLKPDTTTTVRLKAHTTATVRLKPDTTATVQLKPDTTATVRLKPDTTATVRLKPDTTGATVRLKPDTTTAAMRAIERGGAESLEPEILVDPREAAALRAFALRVRDGRTDVTAILRTTPIVVQEPLLDLTIDPIVVVPLRADAGDKGVQP
jgi:hypothetical protein